jgi:hypothetical protein
MHISKFSHIGDCAQHLVFRVGKTLLELYAFWPGFHLPLWRQTTPYRTPESKVQYLDLNQTPLLYGNKTPDQLQKCVLRLVRGSTEWCTARQLKRL